MSQNPSIILKAEDQISSVLDKINAKIKETESHTNKLNKETKSIGSSNAFTSLAAKAAIATGAIYGIVQSVKSLHNIISAGAKFTIETDSSKKAIAGLVASMYQISDANGKIVSGAEKYNAALGVADKLNAKILKKAMQTASSYQSLRDAFQAGIASGASNGFSADQVLDLASTADVVRKMMGLDQNQLVSEFRALLSGQITNNSTIGVALGLKGNEEYKKALEIGKGYEYLTEKMKELQRAGEDASKDIGGVFSTAEEMLQKFHADSTKGYLKPFSELKGILDGLMTENGEWADSLQPVIKLFNDISESVGNGVMQSIKSAIDFAKSFGESLQDSNSFVSRYINLLKDGIDGLKYSISQVIGLFKEIGGELEGNLDFDAIFTFGESTIKLLRTIVTLIVETVQNFFDGVKSIFYQLETAIAKVKLSILNTWNDIVSILPNEISIKLGVDKESIKALEEVIRNKTYKDDSLRINRKLNDNKYGLFSAYTNTLDEFNKPLKDKARESEKISEESAQKEKEIAIKKEKEISEYTLQVQKNIDEKTIEFSSKAADQVVSIWKSRLSYLSELVDFQLNAGIITSEKALSLRKNIITQTAGADLDQAKREHEKQLKDFEKKYKESTEGTNVNLLNPEGKKKFQEYIAQLNKEREDLDKNYINKKLLIEDQSRLKLQKLDKEYLDKKNEEHLNNLKINLSKEKSLIDNNNSNLDLDRKQKLISDKEYYAQKQENIRKTFELERQEINEKLKLEHNTSKKSELQAELYKSQQKEQIALRSIEVERLNTASEMNNKIANASIEMQKVLNSYNKESLDFAKSVGGIGLESYYDQKIKLIQESYDIEKRALIEQGQQKGDLTEINAKLYENELKQGLEVKKVLEEKRNALIEYKNTLIDINNAYLENTSGQLNTDLIKEKFNNSLPIELNKYDEKDRDLVRKHLEVQSVLEQIEATSSNINKLNELREGKLKDINVQFMEGKISYQEYEGLIKTQNELYEEQYSGYLDFISKFKELNLGDNIDQKINDILSRKDEFRKFADEMTVLGEKISTSFEDGFTDILTGQKGIADGFKSMIQDITKEIMNFVAKQLVKKMIGDFMGTGAGQSISNGFTGLLSAFGGTIGGKASGGLVRAGEPLLVGETGKEIFIPSQNGTIYNNTKTNEMIYNNSNKTVINNYTIKGRRGDKFEDSQLNKSAEVQSLLEMSKKNG